MNKYELVYLVNPEVPEEKQVEIADRFKGYIDQMGGNLESLQLWEKRRLAYPIMKSREAFYYIIRFEGSGKLVDELERRMKVTEEVIRFLTVRKDEEVKVMEKRKSYYAKRKTALDGRKKKEPAAEPSAPRDRSRHRHESEVKSNE